MSRTPTRKLRGKSLQLKEFFGLQTGTVTCASFSRTGAHELLATGGDDRHVRLWNLDPADLEPLATFPPAPSEVECLTFTADDSVIIVGTRGGSIALLNVADGTSRALLGHRAAVRCLDAHPFGDYFVSGALDCKVGLWDAKTGDCLQTYRGHTAPVTCVKHSPDGRWVFSGDAAGNVKVWDITAGKLLHEFSALAQQAGAGAGAGASAPSVASPASARLSAVTGMDFHPIEFLLAITCGERVISFWDVEEFRPVSRSPLQSAPVYAAIFSRGGGALVAASADAVKAWVWEPRVECVAALDAGCPALKDLALDEDNGRALGVSVFQNAVSVLQYDISGMPLDAPPEEDEEAPAPAPAVAAAAQQQLQGGGGGGARSPAYAYAPASSHILPGQSPTDTAAAATAASAGKGHRTYTRNQTSADFPLQFGGGGPDVAALEAETRRLSLNGRPAALHARHSLGAGAGAGASVGAGAGLEPYSTPLAGAGPGHGGGSSTTPAPTGAYGGYGHSHPRYSGAVDSAAEASSSATAVPATAAAAPPARVPVSRRTHQPPATAAAAAGAGTALGSGAREPVSFDIPAHGAGAATAAIPPPSVAFAAARSDAVRTDAAATPAAVPMAVPRPAPQTSQSSNLLQGTLVPASAARAERAEVLGLNVNAFLPHVDNTPDDAAAGAGGGGAGGAPSVNAEQVRTSVMNDHNAMVTIASQRLYNLRVLKSFWAKGNVKGAVEALGTMRDLPVAGDFLTAVEAALTGPRSIFGLTLDTAADLLPVLSLLLASRFENYAAIALKYLEFILRSFAEVVATTLATAARNPGGVADISQEDRYARCVRLQQELGAARASLASVAKKYKSLAPRARDATAALDAFLAAGRA